MIELDRSAALPVGEQLAEQLRYRLATGHYRPGERLPSTRALADQVGVSFHTVRKAYQQLADEGLLEARIGSGFVVRARPAEPREDRLERGAALVQEALHRLAAAGLSENEIEYLLGEQMAFFEPGAGRPRILFSAPYRELAESGADQLAAAIQNPVEAVLPAELAQYPEADLVVTLFPLVHDARQSLPQADVAGVLMHPAAETLDAIARLLPHETLGLVTRHADGVGPILQELRRFSGFGGPGLALPAEAGSNRLAEMVASVDLLVYTSAARRSVRGLLGSCRHVVHAPRLAQDAIETVRSFVQT